MLIELTIGRISNTASQKTSAWYLILETERLCLKKH
jgi:hypothetical protein